MSAEERAALPTVIAAEDVARLVVDLLADEGAGGRVVVWESGDEAPRAL
jgi:hypothetical protein